MGIKEAYSEWSSTYGRDGNRTRDLDWRVNREVLAARRFDRILEIGCGTGKNTGFLAGIARCVVAMVHVIGIPFRNSESGGTRRIKASRRASRHSFS